MATIPLAVPDELLEAIRDAAEETRLSQADVMRQSIKLGLPRLREGLAGPLRPLSKAECREAFGPDPEWDNLEALLAKRSHSKPERD